MLRWLLIWALGSCITQAYSQCNTTSTLSGALRVFYEAGCVPHTIRATSSQIDVKNIRYVFEYNGLDESKATKDSTYTYTKPGQYRLLQLSTINGLPARACALITVFDTIPPKFSFTSCRNIVTLQVEEQASTTVEMYRIEWGDGTKDSVTLAQAKKITHRYPTDNSYFITVNRIFVVANCGGKSTKKFTPSVISQLPTISQITPRQSQLQLTINNPGGVRYQLEQQVGSTGYTALGITNQITANPFFTRSDTTQTYCFRLTTVDSCYAPVKSTPICYTPPIPIQPDTSWYLPTAFSPNGDGLNDTFGLLGSLQATGFRLAIYDRWGRLVFESSDPTLSWDGTTNNQPVQTGQYYYRLALWYANQPVRQRKGTVLLVR